MDEVEKPIDNSRIVINLIKSKPELYDPEQENYNNRFAHSKAWKELAAKLNVSVSDLKAKWASLRNSYVRSIRSTSLNNKKPRTKWYLEDSMSFIKPHILRKRKRSNFSWISSQSDDTTDNTTANMTDNTTDNIEIRDANFKEQLKNEVLSAGNATIVINRELSTSNNDTTNGAINKTQPNLIDKNQAEVNNSEKNQTEANHAEIDLTRESPDILEEQEKELNYDGLNKQTALPDLLTSFFEEYSECKLLTSTATSSKLFFKSIKSDYVRLSDKNKRKFKSMALNAINNLLDETEQ